MKKVLVLTFAVLMLLLVMPAIAQPPANLLENPSFEGDFYEYNGIGELTVGVGWKPWFIEGTSQGYHRPEFKAERADVGAGRVLDGQQAQKQFTTFSPQDGGVFQVLQGIEPNEYYEFCAWGYVWSSSDSSDPDVSVPPRGKYSLLVGINPWGDERINYRTTVWGREALDLYDQWVQVCVTAQAFTDKLTVATRGTAEWAPKHNDSYWDKFTIRHVKIDGVEPCPTPEPVPTPPPGDCVTAPQMESIFRQVLIDILERVGIVIGE